MVVKRGSFLRRGLTVLAGVGLVGLATACSTADTRSYKDLRVSGEEVPRVGEAILVREKEGCPISTRMEKADKKAFVVPAVALPLIGLAVDTGINIAEEALKQAAEGLNGSFLALGSIAPTAENPTAAFSCVIVMRGLVGPMPGKAGSEEAGSAEAGKAGKDFQLKDKDIGDLKLADYPAFYVEMLAISTTARVDDGKGSQKDQTTLSLVPVYLHYSQSSAIKLGSGKKNVTMALALGRKQPAGKDELEEGAAAVFRFNFGRLEVGRKYGKDKLSHLIASQVIDESAGPSLAALVTESEEPSIALKALTSAFGSNKADLAKAFKDAFAGDGN